MEEKLRNMEDRVYKMYVWNAKKRRKRGNRAEANAEDIKTDNISELKQAIIYNLSKPNKTQLE